MTPGTFACAVATGMLLGFVVAGWPYVLGLLMGAVIWLPAFLLAYIIESIIDLFKAAR